MMLIPLRRLARRRPLLLLPFLLAACATEPAEVENPAPEVRAQPVTSVASPPAASAIRPETAPVAAPAPNRASPPAGPKSARSALAPVATPAPRADTAPAARPEPTPVAPAVAKRPPPAAVAEPAWMKGCAQRTQAAGAIQCDSDTLLAPPSAKVRVYTREPGLTRVTADGQAIQLREGLPLRYRLFVLP